MKKVKSIVSETTYTSCYTTLSADMIRFYWYVTRESIIEDPRDTVYNMLINADG